jgi:hypothetical protein
MKIWGSSSTMCNNLYSYSCHCIINLEDEATWSGRHRLLEYQNSKIEISCEMTMYD